MDLRGSLRAFVLLSLLAAGCRSAEPDPGVDIDNLAHIIKFFDDNYKQVGKKGVRQYAVAINVDENQCKQFEPDQCNLLTKEEAEKVKNRIYDRPEALYDNNTELIAAGTIKEENHHSEFILMNPPGSSPMTKLLKKKEDGCVVFYTYNSPCLETCISATSKYNILGALKEWSKHRSLKAFVFEKIWTYDENETVLEEVFEAITQYVPLYQCVPNDNRYECVQKRNINQDSVQSQQTRHPHEEH